MKNNSRETERVLKYFSQRKNVLEKFRYVKECLEDHLGIKLTTIEGVGLRMITEKYMQEMIRDRVNGRHYENLTVPEEEIPEIFLYEFYGLFPGDYSKIPREGHVEEMKEEYKEWFRREQARLHHED
jgi:hypothetical protein